MGDKSSFSISALISVKSKLSCDSSCPPEAIHYIQDKLWINQQFSIFALIPCEISSSCCNSSLHCFLCLATNIDLFSFLWQVYCPVHCSHLFNRSLSATNGTIYSSESVVNNFLVRPLSGGWIHRFNHRLTGLSFSALLTSV